MLLEYCILPHALIEWKCFKKSLRHKEDRTAPPSSLYKSLKYVCISDLLQRTKYTLKNKSFNIKLYACKLLPATEHLLQLLWF